MASPWEAEKVEEEWSDREAWRGDRYPDASERWMEEETATPDASADDEHGGGSWRAELPVEDWPEELAGPEYWMYKNMGRQRPD